MTVLARPGPVPVPVPVPPSSPVSYANTMAANQPPPFAAPNQPPSTGYPPPGQQPGSPLGQPGLLLPPPVPFGALAPPGYPPASPTGPRRSGALTTFVTVVVVLAIGAGVATWLLVNKPSNSSVSQVHASRTSASSPASTSRSTSPNSPVTVTVSPLPQSSAPATQPPSGGSGGGQVTLGPGAAGNSQASAVQAFVTSYFSAINAHDYSAYENILTPAEASALSLTEFQSGYGSTRDFNETINSISLVSGGLDVDLSFTSNQRASQSANDSECTDWESVTLYLEDYSGQYLLGPSTVKPAYSDC